MKTNKNILAYILLLTVFLISFLFYIKSENKEDPEPIRDFPEIIESGYLNVIISSNFIDYFVYNGHPMGFYLEILKDFASDNDLTLKVTEESNFENAVSLIKNEDCDIFASDIVFHKWIKPDFKLTIPVRYSKLVLVQRKPDNYKLLNREQIEDSVIRNLSHLKSKKIYSPKYNMRFSYLSRSLTIEVDSLPIEQIVKNVSDKTYDYAVCDYNSAKVLQYYYPNIDINTELSSSQGISWIVGKKSTALLDSLNIWLLNFKETKRYSDLYNIYINNSRTLIDINSKYYSGNQGHISEYDNLFKKYSNIINWDWRLLASLAYEESRFNPDAVSWAGALGLMQMMPYTYNNFSNDTTWQISSQILAGVKYIEYLDKFVPENVNDSVTRIKMILAGYNIGFGHIEDAIRLTQKYGKDINSWNDVSYYLSNLSKEKYYTDPLVQFGYFPGVHAVEFANMIHDRFLHYKNVIPEQ